MLNDTEDIASPGKKHKTPRIEDPYFDSVQGPFKNWKGRTKLVVSKEGQW